MQDRPIQADLSIPDRRNLDRLKLNYPATYTRYDRYGIACEQRISKLVNLSLRGVMLQSSSAAEFGEILDITLALGDNLVTFKGKVIHVTPAKDDGFDLGILIEDIEDQERIVLIRFVSFLQRQLEASE
jgi:hypothetical protein